MIRAKYGKRGNDEISGWFVSSNSFISESDNWMLKWMYMDVYHRDVQNTFYLHKEYA